LYKKLFQKEKVRASARLGDTAGGVIVTLNAVDECLQGLTYLLQTILSDKNKSVIYPLKQAGVFDQTRVIKNYLTENP